MAVLIEWAEAGHVAEGEQLREQLTAQGFGSVVDELTGSSAPYVDRVACIADARNQLTHALELQRLRIEQPKVMAEAAAQELNEESWERLQEEIRRKRDLEKVEAEIPDYLGRHRSHPT